MHALISCCHIGHRFYLQNCKWLFDSNAFFRGIFLLYVWSWRIWNYLKCNTPVANIKQHSEFVTGIDFNLKHEREVSDIFSLSSILFIFTCFFIQICSSYSALFSIIQCFFIWYYNLRWCNAIYTKQFCKYSLRTQLHGLFVRVEVKDQNRHLKNSFKFPKHKDYLSL